MTELLNEEIREAHSRQNMVHTIALLVGIGTLLAVPIGLIWGWLGLLFAAVLIAVMFAGARATPPELVMRAYRARRITAENSTQLAGLIDALTRRAELEATPALYVIPSLTLNAFATGTPKRAAIAITEGLLRKLNIREIAGVLAHEVSHIRNDDLSVMALADIASRIVQAMSYTALFLIVANFFGLLIDGEAPISWFAIVILYLSPLISSLLQLGLSRTREYDADLEAASLIGNPAWLASALKRLEHHTGAFWEDLMYPVPGRRVSVPSLLRSHPRTADRIARLEQLDKRNYREPPILVRDEPFISVISAGPIGLRPRYRFPGVWY